MGAEAISYHALSDANGPRRRAAVPDDVDALHAIEMLVLQIDVQQAAPLLALALLPF
jgi:hypothetical protein